MRVPTYDEVAGGEDTTSHREELFAIWQFTRGYAIHQGILGAAAFFVRRSQKKKQ